jgi:FixJ family two-component response regulator
MNREIRDFNQTMLDFLKENQKRRQETEAYEEAFNKLSNEERKIINSV